MNIVVEPGPAEVGHGGKCNSRLRQSEGRCRKTAGWGTDHQGVGACRLHGGSTRTGRKAAERRVLEGSIRELVTRHRPDLLDVDPQDGLLEVVADTWAMRRALWGLVGDLVPGGTAAYVVETVEGELGYVPAEPAGLWGPDHKGDAKPHVLLGMLHQATEEHLKACKYAIDAGIEERRVRLAEGTAEAIAGVLRSMAAGVLEVLGRLGGDAALVRGVEGELPGVMRGALELARVGAIDVTDTNKET